jgi:hypothetical protein
VETGGEMQGDEYPKRKEFIEPEDEQLEFEVD